MLKGLLSALASLTSPVHLHAYTACPLLWHRSAASLVCGAARLDSLQPYLQFATHEAALTGQQLANWQCVDHHRLWLCVWRLELLLHLQGLIVKRSGVELL